ncbi:MAG: general secretion pathway protein GspK [Bdellovibrionales bacterium]|nr:general secretion pathway protein GspK [Bdellovibrionales bacterium]
MGFRRLLDRILRPLQSESESGIALFMVISSTALLTILVTEFVYVAQMNARIADDGLDQIKAHYLAKNGLKLSLLRLKAYQNVKGVMGGLAGGGASAAGAVPKGLIEKIWSFPFIYPIPSLPGMNLTDREALDKFQKTSTLEGNYVATIESDSNKTNLNMILAPFVASPSPSPSGSTPPAPGITASPSPSPSPFDPTQARQALKETFERILQNKKETDPDFGDEYRGFNLDDLMDQIYAWADRSYAIRNLAGRESVPPKQAPFYSLNELHMVHMMDDTLFDLFAPALTASKTSGINVNTMKDTVLRALINPISEEESKAFFKYRDDPQEDHLFKTEADFWNYAQGAFALFRGDQAEVARYKGNLANRNIFIITDEENFKIVVKATVGSATKTWEVWVTTLKPPNANTQGGVGQSGQANQQASGSQTAISGLPGAPGIPPAGNLLNQLINTSTGLQITFMRLL